MPRHSDWQLPDPAGSWMLRGSVAYAAVRGVSTGAVRDAGGAIGHNVVRRVNDASRLM